MIRGTRKALGVVQATDYFRDEYTRGDYYTGDRSGEAGTWQGRGAERLGLTGRGIKREDFVALLEGRSPGDGRQLVAAEAGTGKHRAAWDFTAAPDKSVSVMALIGPDSRIEAVHLAATGRAFEVLEEQALTKDSERDLVATGNLVIARFDHDASRELDPQLHSHHVIFNLTDRAAGKAGKAAEWRALEPRGLYAAQTLATAVYHAEIARGLQALGYEVRANSRGHARIVGLAESGLAAFSKRRQQIIDELIRQSGSADGGDAQRAALRTRQAKLLGVDAAVLRAGWQAEADRVGLDLAGVRRAADERLARGEAGGPPAPGEPMRQAGASVAWAVEHLSERHAAFRAMDVERDALRHAAARGPGLDEIRAAVAAHPGLSLQREASGAAGSLPLPAARLVTTDAALRLELHNLALVREGIVPCGEAILDRPYDGGGGTLAPDQLRVVRHLLESRESLLGVEGKPGTGKTYALTAVREAAERAGWSVHAYAVTTGAVAQLRAVGLQAATLKSLAGRRLAAGAGKGTPAGATGAGGDAVPGGGAGAAGGDGPAEAAGGAAREGWAAGSGSEPARQLWIVDEAGLMSSRDAATALEGAREAGARLVLVGDRRQHYGVEAGRPWASFQDVGRLRPVRLDAIRRQQDSVLLRAVQLSSEGRAGDAMRHLEASGKVIEIAGARKRHAAMVRELVGPRESPGGADGPSESRGGAGGPRPDEPGGGSAARSLRETLMIAPSHVERRALNALARRELVARGVVAPGGTRFEIAVSKGLTSAQRTDPRHYEVGDVVTYDRAAPSHGFRAGDGARVVTVEPERHTVTVERHRDGARVEYDPRRLRGGDVARVEKRELAAGDRVQFRRADRSRSIPNGAAATVREAAPGRLVLELDAPAGSAAQAGRSVTLEPGRAPLPLDHAYAVTSHAAQGSTVRRVLATFDTRHSAELVNRQQANVTLSRASHQLSVYTDDRGRLPGAVDRQATKTSALDVREAPRRDRHAATPLSRDPARNSGRVAALLRSERPGRDGEPGRDGQPVRDGRPGRTEERRPAERPGRAGGGAADRAGRMAEPAAAPGRRPRARPGGRADRPQRPRDPLPHPGAERAAGEEPRGRGAALGEGRPGGAAERGSAVRGGGGGLDPGDARHVLPAGHGARSAAAPPPPSQKLIVRLIAAAERWYGAEGAEAGRDGAGKAAGTGKQAARGGEAARARQGRAGEARGGETRGGEALAGEARSRRAESRRAGGSRRVGRPGPGGGSRGAGAPANVAPWRRALAAPGPLHHLRQPRAAGAALSAVHRLEDAERQLVRLVKRIGPARALAALPPALALAVRGLRAVARLLSGPSHDR